MKSSLNAIIKIIIREQTVSIRLTIVYVLLLLSFVVPLALDPCFIFMNIFASNVAHTKKTIVDIVIYTILDLVESMSVTSPCKATGLKIYNNIAANTITDMIISYADRHIVNV